MRIMMSAVLLSLSTTALAGTPVDLTASHWNTIGKIKVKTPLGGARGAGWGELYFGPRASSPVLAANEFLLAIDDSQDTINVRGSYTLDRKGKPILDVDWSAFEREIENLFPVSVTVTASKIKMKVRPKSSRKKGESVKVTFKARWVVDYNGQLVKEALGYGGRGGRQVPPEARRGGDRSAAVLADLVERVVVR